MVVLGHGDIAGSCTHCSFESPFAVHTMRINTVATLFAVTPHLRWAPPLAQVADPAPPIADVTPPSPDQLIGLAKEFVATGTGFYSPLRPELLAANFIFRGGVVGPLSKTDYLRTMALLGVSDAFNLQANAFGFTVDPSDPLCVRFFIRNTGEVRSPLSE